MALIVRRTSKPPEWVVIDTDESEIVWHGGGSGTEDDAYAYVDRFCVYCGADIDGNDPHGPGCPREEGEF